MNNHVDDRTNRVRHVTTWAMLISVLLVSTSHAVCPGGSWAPVSTGMNMWTTALEVFDDGSGAALYAGGLFTTAGGAGANYVAKWDGTAWSALGTGMNERVEALAVFDDGTGPALYAGGNFTTAGGVTVNYVAKWDGASWSALTGPSGTGTSNAVFALEVFDDGGGAALYAGGFFPTAGGVPAPWVARWDGTQWSALPSGPSSVVFALAGYDDGGGAALYAGGFFTSAGGVAAGNIAKWNGTAWSAVDPLGLNGSVPAGSLAVLDDGGGAALYVAGTFTTAGGVTVNRIAQWDGTTWSAFSGPSGTGTDGTVRSVTFFDDGNGPAFFAGGEFTTAGGTAASYVAKYSCPVIEPAVYVDAVTHAAEDEDVDVAVRLDTNGLALGSTTFSIDYDESCLDPDTDDDGILDGYTVNTANVPADFTVDVLFDALDTDGEIDVSIADLTPPAAALVDGELLTIHYAVTCEVVPVTPVDAAAAFSLDPAVTFADTASQAVFGAQVDGVVRIWPGPRGDCNGGDFLAAADLTAVGGEIFDGDGDVWFDAPNPTFAGSPVGCDANANDGIAAGDVTCVNLLLFGLACGGGGALRTPSEAPELRITTSPEGGVVWIRAQLTANGHSIGSLAFSLDLDPAFIPLDALDADADGLPDLLRFPSGKPDLGRTSVDAGDADGELDVLLADLGMSPLGDGVLVEVGVQSATVAGGLAVSPEPAASFGTVDGTDVPGVVVVDAFSGPELAVVDADVVELDPATVPVVLTTNGTAVSAVSFSLDVDTTCLSLDPAEAVLSAPPDFTLFVDYDAADTDGEIEISIADVNPPIATLPDGTAVSLTFGVCRLPVGTTLQTPIAFSAVPAPTFGGPASEDLTGTTVDGTLTVHPETDLAIAKLEGADPATSPLTYTLTVTNNGPSDSSGGAATDALPAGLTFSPSPDDCSEAGGTVTCPFGVLAAGAGVDLAFTVTVDPSTPSPIVNQATVAGNEIDPDDSNDSAVEVTSFDGVAPGVTAVASTADTGDGVLGECEEARVDVTELRLTFSEALFHVPPGTDPDDASNAGNYLLVEAGADRDVTTFACGGTAGDDAVAFDSVAYDGAGLATSLGVGGATPLADGVYRLFACGNLRDYAGNPLDGGDFVRTFRVSNANAFVNGQFDCDLGGWTLSDPSDIVHDPVDVDGASVSGSALAMPASGAAFLGQCVEAAVAQSFLLSAWARLSTMDVAVELELFCEGFDQAACGGASLGTVSASTALPLGGEGKEALVVAAIPSGSLSLFCGYTLTENGGMAFDVRLDDLSLELRPWLFADGFESGDTSAWSQAVP